MSKFQALSDAATGGEWGRRDIANDRTLGWENHDSTHNVSRVPDAEFPKGCRVATFTHADDAAFAEALVNAYRSWDLVEASIVAEAVAEERERCAKIADSISIPIPGTPYQAGGGAIGRAIRGYSK